VDAVCGNHAGTIYLNFCFKGGGGAAHQQKLFRLEFIDNVLTAFGFETASRGDMLDAAFARASQSEIQLALIRLGMRLAAIRLMDMCLTSTSR
jgi:pyruvate,water dikinase